MGRCDREKSYNSQIAPFFPSLWLSIESYCPATFLIVYLTCVSVQGVLEHVRLMEIGSEVFAQEVEPTGLLSMEMTLARFLHNSQILLLNFHILVAICPRAGSLYHYLLI